MLNEYYICVIVAMVSVCVVSFSLFPLSQYHLT